MVNWGFCLEFGRGPKPGHVHDGRESPRSVFLPGVRVSQERVSPRSISLPGPRFSQERWEPSPETRSILGNCLAREEIPVMNVLLGVNS